MNKTKLFRQTRISLAISYAGVMGLILSLFGFGTYKAISHAHWLALDRELESLAGALHDSLELKLKQPGKIEPIVYDFLPNLCLLEEICNTGTVNPQRHFLSTINQDNYYVRLFDTSGRLIAITGQFPQGFSKSFKREYWQTLSDEQGNNYRQISVLLHTSNFQNWGYFQVGRNFQDFDDYLAQVKWALSLGLPLSLILVSGASWWLARLAMKPIYQSYKQIEQFTADAAHELRTPLAATLATVESALLMPYLEDKEVREVLKTVERQERNLSELVADLLLLARMDKENELLRRQLYSLNDLVEDLVEELAGFAIASKLDLILEVSISTPLKILCDERQLYRLVTNLIVNGIKYTPAGGTVKVILSRKDRYGVIEVGDTGIGIAASEQKHIFDRFYRVNSDRARLSGGSGLGLAIAKAITLAHQGSLTVRSELGKGTIFTLQLPLAKDEQN